MNEILSKCDNQKRRLIMIENKEKWTREDEEIVERIEMENREDNERLIDLKKSVKFRLDP
jgi:hypothetical protein